MAPARIPGGGPALTIDPAPAYEFVLSLAAQFEPRDTMEVGPDWFAAVESRAGKDLMRRVADLTQSVGEPWSLLLSHAYASRAPRDVPALLEHLRESDADDIVLTMIGYYERHWHRDVRPEVVRRAIHGDADAQREMMRTSAPDWGEWQGYLRCTFDRDPAWIKDELIAVLEAWEASVWRPEETMIVPILERDAEAKRELSRELPLERFTEVATNGVEYIPRPGVRQVVMVPSFVNRPWVTSAEYRDVDIIAYPVADDSVSAETDAPPLRLVRLSKALGDERRLRILRALGTRDMTLMELAEQFGVPKTTMHHHMIALRSAGLVTVRGVTKQYRLRHDALPDVGELLHGYVGAPSGPSAAPTPSPTESSSGPGRRSRRRRRPAAG